MLTPSLNLLRFYGTVSIVLMISSVVFSNDSLKIDHPLEEVTIGEQVWMQYNLHTVTFRNGDSIPEAQSEEAWLHAAENGLPAWCFYDNNAEHGETYGILYNWYAVNDERGLPPEGWRIPDEMDWNELTAVLEGTEWAGLLMKCETSWQDSWLDGDGLNESGFTALPAGYRTAFAWFDHLSSSAFWWSATEAEDKDIENSAFHREVSLNSHHIHGGHRGFNKGVGFSVRCIRN